MFMEEVQQVPWGYATMCCQGLVRVRTLAAEFYTYWSLSRPLLDTSWTDEGLSHGVGAGRSVEVCLRHRKADVVCECRNVILLNPS